MALQFEPPAVLSATIVPTEVDGHPLCCGDDSLQRRVLNFLQSRNILGVDELDIAADGGTITLRGIVASQDAKRLCLECCRHVAGVMTVIDQVTVETLKQDQDSDSTGSKPSLALPKRPR